MQNSIVVVVFLMVVVVESASEHRGVDYKRNNGRERKTLRSRKSEIKRK